MNSNEKMRVMAVGAHPDDLEVLCGGTLAKYREAGYEVFMIHVMNGDKGHYEMTSEEVACVRGEEAVNAGKIIGADVLSPSVPDGELFSTHETRGMMIDLVRQVNPDLIITHDPGDYMSDHVITSQLVCDASFLAATPLFKTKHKATKNIVPLYFMDTLAGVGVIPEEYVDVSGQIDKKKQMIACHRSQMDFLKQHDKGLNLVEMADASGRFRGMQCGVRYAESFRRHNVFGRCVPARLLP